MHGNNVLSCSYQLILRQNFNAVFTQLCRPQSRDNVFASRTKVAGSYLFDDDDFSGRGNPELKFSGRLFKVGFKNIISFFFFCYSPSLHLNRSKWGDGE